MDINYCIIIGTKKGGTTSLYEYLSQHPQIARGTYSKEPNFFGKTEHFIRGFKWYESQFSKTSVTKYLLDATTDYTQEGFLFVPERMNQVKEKIKLIYILRDPFEKIESQHHQFLIDRDTIRPINECIDVRITESAKYYKQLEKYLQYFNTDDIHLISFNDIKNNNKKVLEEVSMFLELETFEFDTSRIHNEKSSAVGQSFKWYKSLRGILRQLNITPLIPQNIKDVFRSFLGKLKLKQIPEEHYRLSEKQKAFLLPDLLSDAENLQNKFNFNPKIWSIYKNENSTNTRL